MKMDLFSFWQEKATTHRSTSMQPIHIFQSNSTFYDVEVKIMLTAAVQQLTKLHGLRQSEKIVSQGIIIQCPFFLSGFDITFLSSTMTVELLAHFTIIYLTGYITVGPHHCIAVQPEIWKIKPLHEYEFWSHWQNSGSSGIGVFYPSQNATQGKDCKP